MKNRISEPNHEENHFVKARLVLKDFEINNVPCKIYLPERIYEKPYMVFKTSEEYAHKMLRSHKGALRATIFGFDKKIQTTIEVPEVYFSESHKKYWGYDISETTVTGEPQDLHLIHHRRNHDDQIKTNIVFWISPNKLLTPNMTPSSSYDGTIGYKRINNFEFRITDNIEIVFDKHFSSKTEKNGDKIQWSFLVACADLDTPAEEAQELKTTILPIIDDFLLIASFAARKRTACLGWTASDNKSCTTFYRGNYVFPKGKDDSSADDGVIDIRHFDEFLQTCHPAFLSFQNKLAIRNALYSSVPSTHQTLEASFLRTFSGLETLILNFRRIENVEFVFPENEWQVLRKYLEKSIKNFNTPRLEPVKRASIYHKLDELNRVSLRESFKLFCQKYAIDLEDIWPIFGSKEKRIVGLVDIRNRLSHGDPFPRDLYDPLIVANEHMRYTLERVIVSILDWDVEKTKISPDFLKNHFLVIKDLPSSQERLYDYIQT